MVNVQSDQERNNALEHMRLEQLRQEEELSSKENSSGRSLTREERVSMCERVARLLRLTTDLQEDRILGEKNVVVTEEGTWLPAQAASALQDKHAREVMPTTAERDAATKDLFVSGSLLRAPINWGDQAIGNDGSVELPKWYARPS